MSNVKEMEFRAWIPLFPSNVEAAEKFYAKLGRMSRPSFGFSFYWNGERREDGDGGTKFFDHIEISGQEAVHFEYAMDLVWLAMEMEGEEIMCSMRDMENDGGWMNVTNHCDAYTREEWKKHQEREREEFMKKMANRKIEVVPARKEP